jgi:hypothetical protein
MDASGSMMDASQSNFWPALILSVAIVAVLPVVITIAPRYLALLLGALLPIYAFPSVDPVVLDLLRYFLAVALLLRTTKRSAPSGLYKVIFGVLIVLASAWSVFSLFKSAPVVLPVTMIMSVALGGVLAVRDSVRVPLLTGFVIGAIASAGAALLQASGLLSLGSQDAYGLRYAGLSSTATLFGAELAVAVAIVLGTSPGRSTWRWIGQASVLALLFAAILVSGSRAALLVAALLALPGGWRLLHRRPIIGVVLSLAGLLIVVKNAELFGGLNTIRRLVSETRTYGFVEGLQSSRLSRNLEAWSLTWDNLASGVDGGILRSSPAPALNPHFFPLVAGLQIGIIGLLLGAIAVALAVAAWAASVLRSSPHLARGLLFIAMFYCFVEPTAFFVGLPRVTILFVALALSAPSWESRTPYGSVSDATREPIPLRSGIPPVSGGK